MCVYSICIYKTISIRSSDDVCNFCFSFLFYCCSSILFFIFLAMSVVKFRFVGHSWSPYSCIHRVYLCTHGILNNRITNWRTSSLEVQCFIWMSRLCVFFFITFCGEVRCVETLFGFYTIWNYLRMFYSCVLRLAFTYVIVLLFSCVSRFEFYRTQNWNGILFCFLGPMIGLFVGYHRYRIELCSLVSIT